MIKIGLVGCGAAGMSHLHAMQSVKGLKIEAVCDINADFAARASLESGAPWFIDAGMMMRKAELDAVAVITTAHTHYQVAKLAAENNLPVLIEKPLTLDPKEGAKLVDVFKRKKLLLAVTFTYRYVSETRKMKEIIDSGAIGTVLEMRHIAWGGFPEKFPEGTTDRVKYDRMYGKDIRGILFDCGVHTFDLFRWLSGQEYVKFLGMGVCHAGYEFPDSGSVLCEMTHGVRGVYDHGPLPWFLGGESGIGLCMICVAGTKGSIIWKIVDRKENGKYVSEFQVNTAEKQTVKKMPLFSKCREDQHADFVKSVKAGKLSGCFPDPQEANVATLSAQKAVDAVMRNIVGKTTVRRP